MSEFFPLTRTRHTRSSAEKLAQKYKSFSRVKIEQKTLKNMTLKVSMLSFRIGSRVL